MPESDGRITVLVENTAGASGLLGEHGLALWIEIAGKRILFDTGQGNVLAPNARRLGIRLETADAIVLSHGHYDHTGGLSDALHAGRRPAVYAHPAAFEPKYARNADRSARDVGISTLNAQAVRDQAEWVRVEEPTEICGGLTLTGPIPRTTDFEDTGGAFFTDAECTEPDMMPDDQAAFVQTPDGTVVILGCAHAGVINTVRHVQTLTDGRAIHTVIGGMHLVNAGPDRLDKTVAALRRLDIQRLLPCHCTGFAAMARLRHEFPNRCAACPVGTVVEINEHQVP
ncbi:MAG: MBL fold metallo-hydrolase [Phycisphaerae bacterium]|nr:MBL fold metallo-hydrolase [Phycisphaerae bacterium]